MSTSRTGFPPIRLALIIGVVGLLLLGAGVAAFFIDQASRQAPLQISLFPAAEYWGENEVTANSRHLFYRASDTPEAVAAFYQQRMRDHYGSSDQGCIRLPPEGNDPRANTDVTLSPYQFACMFDRSGFRSTQYTRVVIYPGKAHPDPFYDAEGQTIIRYEQQWQR